MADIEPMRAPIRSARLGVDDSYAVVLASDDALWRYAALPRPLPREEIDTAAASAAAATPAAAAQASSASVLNTLLPRQTYSVEQYPLSNVRAADFSRRQVSHSREMRTTPRSTVKLTHSQASVRQSHALQERLRQLGRARDEVGREVDGLFERYHIRRAARSSGRRDGAATEEAQVDGLGDRNRSLSPEGDHVWDTLLSTLTPDPQPPSVGSSFASASASAVASQTGPTSTSGSSLPVPDGADESLLEHPCESGFENSDTEGEEDDAMERSQSLLTRLANRWGRRNRPGQGAYVPLTRRTSRSNSNDDLTEALGGVGGIGGMQRIVSNLARREDIPDEWWAEAGLSRTLSREASTN